MQKLLILSIIIFFFSSAFAQTKIDTLINDQGLKVQKLEKRVGEIQVNIDTVKAYINIQKGKSTRFKIGITEWILIFSPIWIFSLLLLILRKKLRGLNLREVVAETELPKKTIINPEYTIEKLNALSLNPTLNGQIPMLVPPTIDITAGTDYPKSSSRYIALITSALTWIIVLCFSCFFLYQYISTSIPPDLSGISNVMLALGIGVVPYAFNKVSAAMK